MKFMPWRKATINAAEGSSRAQGLPPRSLRYYPGLSSRTPELPPEEVSEKRPLRTGTLPE